MNIVDMIVLGLSNLKQRKLRTFLTTLGVIVGIGALSSMVSFGTGLQKNISDAFADNDLFTSLRVTAKKIDLDKPTSILDSLTPLSDSVLKKIQEIEEIDIAFPDLLYPCKIELNGKKRTTQVSGIPAQMKKYPPYSNLLAGGFFPSDSAQVAIISKQLLKQLKILLKEDESSKEITEKENAEGYLILPADSIIGSIIKIKTVVFDVSALNFSMFGFESDKLPLKDTTTEATIAGIIETNTAFVGNILKGGVILPYHYATTIPRVDINSAKDFLNRDSKNKNSYSSIYARASSIYNLEIAKKKIEEIGLNVFTMGDRMAEIKKAFLIIDSILGAVGLIALFVASLGIVNTMVMSIMERTREIGIMKSIGASNGEIKLIFFVEASVIGFLGGVLGLILGWLVTRLANLIMNSQLKPLGETPVDLFYFPVWLIVGSLIFSIIISLLAGLYPAVRASKIDPVKALRHD